MRLQKDATLSELSTCFFDNVIKNAYATSTYQSYKTRMDKHVIPIIGAKQVKDINKLDIQNLMFELCNDVQPLSANTIRLVKSILHRILEFAVDVEITDKNASDRVLLPNYAKYRPRIYTKDEIQNLLDIAKGSVLYLPILIAVKTGLRRSEILSLQGNDIDLLNATIAVRKSTRERSFTNPKTKYSARYLKVPDSLIIAINNYLQEQRLSMMASGNIQTAETFLVSKPDGSQYSPSYLSRKFNEFLKTHHLPAIRFHDLRHAYATHAHNNGMPIKNLSLSLGHHSAATTIDNYVEIEDIYTVFC